MSSWTPAQRRAYAIRKAKERQRAERAARQAPRESTSQRPEAGYEVHPDDHPCSPWEIEWEDDFNSRCTGCGRRWVVRIRQKKDGGTWREIETFPVTRKLPPVAA